MKILLDVPDELVRAISRESNCSLEDTMVSMLSMVLTEPGRSDNDDLRPPKLFNEISNAERDKIVQRMVDFVPPKSQQDNPLTCADIYLSAFGLGWHELSPQMRDKIGRMFNKKVKQRVEKLLPDDPENLWVRVQLSQSLTPLYAYIKVVRTLGTTYDVNFGE